MWKVFPRVKSVVLQRACSRECQRLRAVAVDKGRKEHSALLCWCVMDEAGWRSWSRAGYLGTLLVKAVNIVMVLRKEGASVWRSVMQARDCCLSSGGDARSDMRPGALTVTR